MSITEKRVLCNQCRNYIHLFIPRELKDELYYYFKNDLLDENGNALTDLPCQHCGHENSYTVIKLLYLLGEDDVVYTEIKKKEKFVKEY